MISDPVIPPYRRDFDASRDPYAARVALGLGNTLTDVATLQTYLRTTPVAVANLPAAGTVGRRAFVTDSSVAAAGNFGAIVAAGAANKVPVFDDGTNWRIG